MNRGILPLQRRNFNQSIIRMPVILPDRIQVTMRYRESLTMSSTAGLGTYRFSMNSIFDPNVTGGGHQPLGYDQWAAFYQQYEVKASHIKCMLLPPTITVGRRFIIYPSTTLSTVGSARTGAEQAYAKTTVINSVVLSKYHELDSYMTIRKLEGRNTASINFTAPFGASPSLERYWHIMLFALDGTTSVSTDLVDVEILYYCYLFNRYNLNESN
jgi:hypothetical protein